MNRDFVIDLIKTFNNNDFNEVVLKLKNGSSIVIDTDNSEVYYGYKVMEINFKCNEHLFIRFSYELIDEIIINSK